MDHESTVLGAQLLSSRVLTRKDPVPQVNTKPLDCPVLTVQLIRTVEQERAAARRVQQVNTLELEHLPAKLVLLALLGLPTLPSVLHALQIPTVKQVLEAVNPVETATLPLRAQLPRKRVKLSTMNIAGDCTTT